MFVSLQNRHRKDVWRCQETKEAFLNNEKYVFYIVEKWNIFQRGQQFELSSLFVFIEERPRNNVWGYSR